MFDFSILALIFWAFLGLLFVYKMLRTVQQVPQQHEFIVERLGKYRKNLKPGLHFLLPFLDNVTAKQDLREKAIEVPPQLCFTKDNVKVEVDGVLYLQVTDAYKATYGVTDYQMAAISLAQTTTRSVVGTMELDRTFEERDEINARVRGVLEEIEENWGVTVKRYEIKNIVPPDTVRVSMEQQMSAERERRAILADSEGKAMAMINDSSGIKAETINRSEGERQSRINEAEGRAAEILSVATATADSIRKIGAALTTEGGAEAIRMQLSQKYFGELKKIGGAEQQVVLPANLGDIDGLLKSIGLDEEAALTQAQEIRNASGWGETSPLRQDQST